MTDRHNTLRRLDVLTKASQQLASQVAGDRDRASLIARCADALGGGAEPDWATLPDPPTARALAHAWRQDGPEAARGLAARDLAAAEGSLARRERMARETEALRAAAEAELAALDGGG